ncbi:MAG: 50S ribosomal protein L1 [Candidatus Omnitrophica bacterium]|nr:50S ribosomal protein L1 [Candidatus Omnitrophota bacterium]
MLKVSKRMKSASLVVGEKTPMDLGAAVDLIAKFPKVKFDETVELHFHLHIDPKKNEESVRGTVVLPHGLGKAVRIAVVCKGEVEKKARDAGADVVGGEELIAKVLAGFMDFDVVVATPDMMRDLSKLGKLLGPRGLMPTPKAGTVTLDVEKAIKELKAGKIEFKSDKQAGIHVGIGKVSFSKDKLLDNAKTIMEAINTAKPNSVKGVFIRSLSLSTSMGPGLRILV